MDLRGQLRPDELRPHGRLPRGLYAADVDAGRITEEDGVQIVLALYKHFKEINKIHDCRVIIGGLGRRRPEAADRLAMVIMEASRRFREVVPQLTLRYYSGMSEEVFRKAMESTPRARRSRSSIRRNEHPAVQKVYGVSREEAEQYVPFGCGEYVLVGRSVGTPNNGINALKALEIALHNGVDKFQNVRCGVETGALSEFDTFEKLYDAVLAQLKPIIDSFAVHKYLNYAVAGENAPYLHLSLLLDDCIARASRSSRAACRYLKDLYAIYNDWTLAIAAYNCGPGNVNKAMARSGGKTFWEIYDYLPARHAATSRHSSALVRLHLPPAA